MRSKVSHNSYSSLIYNGKKYQGKEALLNLADTLLDEGFHESAFIADFLKAWLDNSDYISLQTSGSTGDAKVISVSKDAMITSARRTLDFLELQAGDTVLLCLSAKYIAGKMMLVRAMVGELNLIRAEVGTNPLQGILKVDFAAMVPMQVRAIINTDKKQLNKVRKLIIGGGAVENDLVKELENLKLQAWETYGMTETVSHIALKRFGADNVFRLLPDLSISLDERSCLVIEPSDINAERLITNDIVELLTPDSFIFNGRFDNVINSGGVKISPERVEAKMKLYLSYEFVISYLNDSMLGQKLVLVFEAEKPDADIVQKAIASLDVYERPKAIYCIPMLPRTETGKIKRFSLHQQLNDLAKKH